MLHLIWQKDDSATSEDGEKLKGIRPRLIETYSAMFFEPTADLEPKQQVGRIAKNMIECASRRLTRHVCADGEFCRLTYYATLAELTSLEEMLRILMDTNQVHEDVINKLWQVYSQ